MKENTNGKKTDTFQRDQYVDTVSLIKVAISNKDAKDLNFQGCPPDSKGASKQCCQEPKTLTLFKVNLGPRSFLKCIVSFKNRNDGSI